VPADRWTRCTRLVNIGPMATQQPTMLSWDEPLNDAQKWRAILACAGAALLIRYAGELALWPRDPYLAVSLAACARPGMALVELVALAGVTSALVAAIVGRRAAGVGVLAVGIGLLALGWGEADWRLVVAYAQARHDWAGAELMLAAETLGWLAVVLAAVVAEHLAGKWLNGRPERAGVSAAEGRESGSASPVAMRHVRRVQAMMFVAAGLAGIVVAEVLSAGSPAAENGQGYFVAAVAMLAGVGLAHQIFPGAVLWPAATAWVIPALVGYVWGLFSGAEGGLWMVRGVNPLANLLPLHYAAGGTIGGMVGLWASCRVMKWRSEV